MSSSFLPFIVVDMNAFANVIMQIIQTPKVIWSVENRKSIFCLCYYLLLAYSIVCCMQTFQLLLFYNGIIKALILLLWLGIWNCTSKIWSRQAWTCATLVLVVLVFVVFLITGKTNYYCYDNDRSQVGIIEFGLGENDVFVNLWTLWLRQGNHRCGRTWSVNF